MIFLFLLAAQLQSILWLVAESATTIKIPITKEGCQDTCGGIKIPYPFGIGSNCYHDKSYEIFCNESVTPHRPFLLPFDVEVLFIGWDGTDDPGPCPSHIRQTITVNTVPLDLCTNNNHPVGSINLTDSPFTFAPENKFNVEGCPARMEFQDSSGRLMVDYSCKAIKGTDCSGLGCCDCKLLHSSEAVSNEYYQVSLDNSTTTKNNHPVPCNMSAVISYPLSGVNYSRAVPTLLNWEVTYTSEEGVSNGATCVTDYGNFGCRCEELFIGNPYLPYGCKKVDAHHFCVRVSDGWTYVCYDTRRYGEILGFSISTGVLFLLLVGYLLCRVIRRKITKKKKANFFKRNGGLLLQQQMTTVDGVIEKTKIFTIKELEKATNDFNKNRILGQGGQGTVYKGMLVDGKIVAIKKSKKVDEGQLGQFINEVVLLSQINHRNVVKLLGCCLETKVPLLVYEFIPNGTLYEHIQDPSEDFQVTWNMRLQIAAESAGAISYLHSSSSNPIYHRDIKSTNILLDDKYRAKVSDFGASRAITIDQTHVTTCVQGTYGYLDPEYFQSNQFTDKSDVYSFGVVLVELLTGKRPIHPTESGGWISLASKFITHMECSRLLELLDTRVYEERNKEEFVAVANLARQCLRMNAKKRPTMTEVARVLEDIRSPHFVSNAARSRFGEDENVVRKMDNMMSFPDHVNDNSFCIEVAPLMAITVRAIYN